MSLIFIRAEQKEKVLMWWEQIQMNNSWGFFCLFFNLLSLWSVFPDFSWFPQYGGWDYWRSCCLAIKKILFYHKSCSIFLFPPLLFCILSQILICVLWNSETSHIPGHSSHSQPGWQANAWLFWCKAWVDGQAVQWRIEGSFSHPAFPIQPTRKEASNPVWAFNKSWTSGQQLPQKHFTNSLWFSFYCSFTEQ